MGVLLVIALVLAIPSYGLSLLPVVGALTLRAWAQASAAATPQPAAPAAPQPASARRSDAPAGAAPSWTKDDRWVERFRSDLLDALPCRGVPRTYGLTLLSAEETARLALASAHAAEESGRDFYRQCFATADHIVRQWNALQPAEQTKFRDSHF